MNNRQTHRNWPDDWPTSSLGQALVSVESDALQRLAAPLLLGRKHFQLGLWGGETALTVDPRQTATLLAMPGQRTGLAVDPNALPIERHAADSILLPHSLEASDKPLQLLNECTRALSNRGHLIVLGFERQSRLPQGPKVMPARQLQRHLADLDFRVCRFQRLWFRPFRQAPGLLRWTRLLEPLGQRFWPFLGRSYLLVAHRDMNPPVLLRQRWIGLASTPSVSMVSSRVRPTV